MSKRVIGLMAATLMFALVAFANDPWKDKDFTSWDAKDVQKILTDSPWSKHFQYGFNAAGSGGAPITSAGPAANPQGMGGGGGDGGGGGSRSGLSGNSGIGQSSGGMGQEQVFTVSWISSRTVREAMARKKELAGTSPDEARKELSGQSDTYVIAVLGTNLSAFGKESVDSLKAHTYLMPKDTKEKIAPSKVVIQQGSDSRRPVGILFEFPKKTDAGSPTIAANEKSLEFGTAAGTTPVKVTFDLSKMMDKQGADM